MTSITTSPLGTITPLNTTIVNNSNTVSDTTIAQNSYTFDLKKFNQDFEDYLANQKKARTKQEQKYLESKEIIKRDKLLHELTFYEILGNTKDTVFNVMDDLTTMNINRDTLTQENRLFYIGLLLIVFSIFLLGIYIIIPKREKKCVSKAIYTY